MNDRFTIRAVVNYLGLIAVVGLAGVIWLVNQGVNADQLGVIVALVGPSIGALGALLASVKTGDPAPAPPAPTPAGRAAAAGPVGDAAP